MRVSPISTAATDRPTCGVESGNVLMCGAAGSGKTHTAIAHVDDVCRQWSASERLKGDPLRVLFLTYNVTLASYVRELFHGTWAEANAEVSVSTFAAWAAQLLGAPPVAAKPCEELLRRHADSLNLVRGIIFDEANYILDRFDPQAIDNYLTAERACREFSTGIDLETRRRILDEVVHPYRVEKEMIGWTDWNDVALNAADASPELRWDVVVIDEAQDFSGNQIRAINRHLAERAQVIYIMDDAQCIYGRYFGWREVEVPLDRIVTLNVNHRNTRQIADFARGIIRGLPTGRASGFPDGRCCERNGPQPTVIEAGVERQIDLAMAELSVILQREGETVAFLFAAERWDGSNLLSNRLDAISVDVADLTRAKQWPCGGERVVSSTIHSAAGLEFDHVYILGLDQRSMPGRAKERDDLVEPYRRLLAMGAGRARRTVTVGIDPQNRPDIANYLDRRTYRAAS